MSLKRILSTDYGDLSAVAGVPALDVKTILGIDPVPPPFEPSQISNLLLWIDASQLTGLANNDPVTNLADFSGNGYNFNEGSDASRPTYITGAQNGLPVVRFGGSHGRQLPLAQEAAFDLTQFSIFFVAKRTANNGSIIAKNTTSTGAAGRRKLQMILHGTSGLVMNSGTDGTAISQAATTTVMDAFGVNAHADNNNDLWVAGAAHNKTTTLGHSTYNSARVEIGQAFSNGAERFTGDLAELIMTTGVMSSDDIADLLAYWDTKWGL